MTLEAFLLFAAIATVVAFLLGLAGFIFALWRQGKSYQEFEARRQFAGSQAAVRNRAGHRFDPTQPCRRGN